MDGLRVIRSNEANNARFPPRQQVRALCAAAWEAWSTDLDNSAGDGVRSSSERRRSCRRWGHCVGKETFLASGWRLTLAGNGLTAIKARKTRSPNTEGNSRALEFGSPCRC